MPTPIFTRLFASSALILTSSLAVSAQGVSTFVSTAPCRIVDSRDANLGSFGTPALPAGTTRSFIFSQGSCNLPTNATAFAVNVTVVPQGSLPYLTMWPTGRTRPEVSTLNSYEGRVVANSTIVPIGDNGSISVFVAGATDLIIDVQGYFLPQALPQPITPAVVTTGTRSLSTVSPASTSLTNTSTALNVQTAFTQLTGTDVIRPLSDKLADHINVKDYGAQCNGVADDTAAFQAAHDAATYGLTIEIPPGVCVIRKSINVSRDNIKFKGAGQAATYLSGSAGLTVLFNVNSGGSNQVVMPEFSDFTVDLANAPSATAFYFAAARVVNISRVFTINAFRSYWFDHISGGRGSTSVHLSDFEIDNTPDVAGARGILIDGMDDDWFISNGRLFQGAPSQNNVGLEIRSGGGFMINSVDISGYGNGLLIDPPANSYVRYAQIHGLQCDSSWNDAAVLDGTVALASGYPNGVYNLHFVNSWFSSAGAHGGNGNGLNIVSAQGIVVDTSQFYSNSMNGLRLQAGARDITITSNQFSGNSNGYGNGGANTGKYSGISVDNGTYSFGLLNNRSGLTSVYSNTQAHGIYIGAGAHHYRIIGNDLVNNLSDTLKDTSQSQQSVVGMNLLN